MKRLPPSRRGGRIAYLCLQATTQGQASYAHVHEIARGLRRRGWEVVLHLPGYSGREDRPTLLERAGGLLRPQLQLLRHINAFDAVYIRSHFAALPVAFVAKLLRVPVFHEVNGTHEDLYAVWPATRPFGLLFEAVQRVQWRLAVGLIVVTPGLAKWIRREVRPRTPVVVIPNGANTELFTPDARQRRDDLPRPYVVFVGTLAPWQGLQVLLSAVEHPSWPTDVSLVIVGDGYARGVVQAAAARDPRIAYLGRVAYTDIPGIVAGAMCAMSLQSTRSRPAGVNPLKVYEALACAVPMVVTDVPGQADLVRSAEAGIVVPSEDSAAVARAVAWLRANPAERTAMGARGCRAVTSTHSWDARASATDSILRNVLGQTGSAP